MLASKMPAPPTHHDADFRRLDDADEPSLVVVVGELARQRREEEEGQDEQRLRDGAELKLLRRVGIELIGDEQHDRLFEQAVVERAEELGREQGQEPPLAQQVRDVLNHDLGAPALISMPQGVASFAREAKPYKRALSVNAVAAQSSHPVAHLRGADPGVPAVAAGAARLRDHLRPLLHRRDHRLFRRLSGPCLGQHFQARPVSRSDRRQDHDRRRC